MQDALGSMGAQLGEVAKEHAARIIMRQAAGLVGERPRRYSRQTEIWSGGIEISRLPIKNCLYYRVETSGRVLFKNNHYDYSAELTVELSTEPKIGGKLMRVTGLFRDAVHTAYRYQLEFSKGRLCARNV